MDDSPTQMGYPFAMNTRQRRSMSVRLLHSARWMIQRAVDAHNDVARRNGIDSARKLIATAYAIRDKSAIGEPLMDAVTSFHRGDTDWWDIRRISRAQRDAR